MLKSAPFDAFGAVGIPEILWEDDERIYCKIRRNGADGIGRDYISVIPSAEHPNAAAIDRLGHEYGLRGYLDASWALRPVELVSARSQTMLVLEFTPGEPLHHWIGAAMDVGRFLQIAVAITKVICRLHESGLIHRNIKPCHFLIDGATGDVRLTGFGIATRSSREHQSLHPPDVIAGTLQYMAPEQTGRMNRSIDSRTDLYSLGVTLYQTLTGRLPFLASEPMEWVHCHIARMPAPPHELYEAVPYPVSAIIMKLLAKIPEDRYQTALGVECDLAKCLAEWKNHRQIGGFDLGQSDVCGRLLMPERLYARTSEATILLGASKRVVETGFPELVLVSGHAGTGKSALVNELHKAAISSGGLFAAGKFDQYMRDVPYATLAQAFQHLVRQLLNKPEYELSVWRRELTAALVPYGQLMVNLIPQLALIIGEQPPIPRIEPKDAQARFHRVFQSLLGVFARKEHPLFLFIDDLQWLDVATLEYMKQLVTSPNTRHVLVIGAYRDNEIHGAHPLTDMIEAIRNGGISISEISLAALHVAQVAELVSDVLHTNIGCVRQLAELVSEKTGGNPFFTIQFIGELAEERLLTFDSDSSMWKWDLERIRSKNISDNIADLMAGKLNRLPAATRDALGQLACLGNAVSLPMLMAMRGTSEEELNISLRDAVEAGLLIRTETSFAFIHDRVHEAAYAMMSPEDRVAGHLKTARAILSNTGRGALEERIFEIADQFNRGHAGIRSPTERLQVAELNLIAGQRARTASAYSSAKRYFNFGKGMLPHDSWLSAYRLTFDLERYRAECDFVLGDLSAAEECLATLRTYAATLADETEIVCRQLLVYFTAGKQDVAIELGLAFLQRVGNALPPYPSDEDVKREYRNMNTNLERSSIEDFIELPQMTAPAHLATMEVLTELYPAASTAETRSRALADLIVLRMTNISLENGNCDASSVAYSGLSLFLATRFDDYLTAYRFGQLACDLADRRGTDRSKGRAYAQSGSFAMPWFKSFRECRSLLMLAFTALKSTGDTAFAAYTLRNILTNLLVSGTPLGQLQRQAEEAVSFARAAGFGPIVHRFVGHRWLAASLRGIEVESHPPDDDWARQNVAEQRGLAQMASYHWVFKLQERFFAADYLAALEAAAFVEPIRWAMLGGLEEFVYDFYAALSHAAMCGDAVGPRREEHLKAVRKHARRISAWSENCPENFANCQVLVLAELARLEGRDLDAQHLYEEAIRLALEHGFLQNEGLSSELAARFYRGRGFERIATAYAQGARSCYLRWGAVRKVRELEQLYLHLHIEPQSSNSTSTIQESVESLDLAAMIKVSQTVSGEIVLEKLITSLMRLAIEHAGAERGLLILARGDAYEIAAEATTYKGSVVVNLRQATISPQELPETVFQYVARTKESVLLHDALAEHSSQLDDYIVQNQARSVLCLPLLKQARLLGVLYLENNLTPHVFTSARIAILKLLASAAAISLENARLYSDLREREAKVRRLVDSNIIGIFIWDADGRIIEANEAFLRIVGHGRIDFASGHFRWRDLTPAEWLTGDEQRLVSLGEAGSSQQPYEKEFFRKDGTRVPVLIGAALFDEPPTQGVAFVLDLTDRNRAEQAARDSDRKYHELQLQLVHANRVATMGELSAAIAHDVRQPLSGIVSGANAGMNWLNGEPPNLLSAKRALTRVLRDGHRAAEVLDRTRALFKNEPQRLESLNVNAVVSETILLVAQEVDRLRIHLEVTLAEGLPQVLADRIQLQQVLLNLLLNALEALRGTEPSSRLLNVKTLADTLDHIDVKVSDSGPGLPEGGEDRIFEAFFTTKSEGIGMGLAICRSILESYGGRIWAQRAAIGGAEFTFVLPRTGLQR